MSLLDRKLLLVTGKGGVGRTTVAITLALAAGLQGKRAAVFELYGNDQVFRRFALGERSYAPRVIAPGVETASLTSYECLDDFGREKLKVNALVRMVFHNRVFRAFIDAVPGMHDLFHLGKINHLATSPGPHDPNYDLIVIDAPATGHGLTLLNAAGSIREMVGGGLVADEARLIEAMMYDPSQTGLVLVTLPDELPVNEGLELAAQLGPRGDQLAAYVINQVRTFDVPKAPPWQHVRDALIEAGRPEVARLGDATLSAARRQEAALERVRNEGSAAVGHAVPSLLLPRIEPRELRASDLDGLARALLTQLDGIAP